MYRVCGSWRARWALRSTPVVALSPPLRVVDVAIERKLQEALKAGVPKPLTTKDLLAAAGTLKATTREWFATARNYALYSNQGGIYDDILQYLKL